MRILRRRATEKLQVPAEPRHRADPAQLLEERRRRLRLEDQARLDAIGLPRYVRIVDSE